MTICACCLTKCCCESSWSAVLFTCCIPWLLCFYILRKGAFNSEQCLRASTENSQSYVEPFVNPLSSQVYSIAPLRNCIEPSGKGKFLHRAFSKQRTICWLKNVLASRILKGCFVKTSRNMLIFFQIIFTGCRWCPALCSTLLCDLSVSCQPL